MNNICCSNKTENGSAPDQKGRNGTQVVIPIGGMHCPSCAANIEKSLRCINGVIDANVNFIGEKVAVRYDPYRTDIERIKKAITRPGYLIKETLWERTHAFWAERIFFARMVFCAVLVIAVNMLGLLKIAPGHIILNLTLSNLLSLGVIVIGGYPIFKGAVQALLVKDLTVFSLVSIAGIAATVVGAYKEAAMVILIMLIGETLERFALRKSRNAITKLLNLAPVSALVRRNGNELEIPADAVKPDDIVIIKPGTRIPVDGVIIKGEGSVNESTLTGESLPVDKKEGDTVYSGTINEGNAFDIKATRTGDDTRFALIKRLILEAESQKAPIQRIADRYARYFVPIAILISLLAYLFTSNIYTAVTILIVVCPCTLVLVTPTAVVAGLTNASRKGILIKGGQYLEVLGQLDALLIDKTGTLTSGKLSVTDIIPLENMSENDVLMLAAVAEKRSEHPIAKSIIRKANEMKLNIPDPDNFELFKGSGVKITHQGETILVGNNKLILTQQVSIGQNISQVVSQLEEQGKTTLLVVRAPLEANNNINSKLTVSSEQHKDTFLTGRNAKICGIIGLSDTLKSNAVSSIQRLKQMGLKKIAVITGDNPRVAAAITKEVGLEEYYAQVLPEDKVNKIKELKQEGFRVGMVGDGVNDAPALAASDVGLAMGAFGSDVAIEAADISLMSDDLSKIPAAISLSHRVLSIIRQNFIFAIVYNVIMIALVSQFVHEQHNMVWGAVAHQVSSLFVILNSMRLLR